MQQVYAPYQYFTDKNGLPLDDGYIYVGVASLDPVSNPVTVYYDAAGTIPAAQPLRTVNGTITRNGSPARIYVSVDTFSVTVKQSNYSVVSYTEEASQLIDSSHVTYKLTNVYDKLDEFISPIDFGAKFDGVTDDTVAIQAAINYASNNKSGKVWLPGGVAVISKLYFQYDAVNNPGFKQGNNYQGRIEFVGQGYGDKNNLKQSQYVGTTFISTITSGNVFTFDAPSGDVHNKACVIGNFSVKAQTSGHVFYLKIATIGTIFENIVVYNNAAGTILEVENTWSSLFKNMQLAGDGSTGTGFAATGSNTGGGNIMLVNVNCEDLLQGFVFGTPYDANKVVSYKNITTICCQAGECTTTGLALKQGILNFYGKSWFFEGCDSFANSCSVKISDQAGIDIVTAGDDRAGSIVFDGGWSTADQSDPAYSHFRVGTDTATSPNDAHGPVYINKFVFGNVYGSAIECTNDAANFSVTIDSPAVRYIGSDARMLRIKDEVQYGQIKLRGKMESFTAFNGRLVADATNAKMDHRVSYDYYGNNIFQGTAASANSMKIYPTDGDFVVVSGTVTINEILKPDYPRRVVFRFESNPTITNNATPSSSKYAAIQTKANATFNVQTGAILEMVYDTDLEKWLVISNTSDEVVIYTGAVTINELLTPTNAISLTYIFTGAPTVTNNYNAGVPSAGYSVILLAGGVDFTASANDVLTLVYHPIIGKFLEKSRSVN